MAATAATTINNNHLAAGWLFLICFVDGCRLAVGGGVVAVVGGVGGFVVALAVSLTVRC